MTEKKLTPEEIEKKNRLRKNLRLLALAAACYYFISAGLNFYEDSQAEKVRILKDIPLSLVSKQDFTQVLQAVIPGSEISIEGDHETGLVLNHGTSTSIEISEGQYGSLIFSFDAPFPEGGLSDGDMGALRAYLTACENTTEEKTIDEIIRVLGLNKKSPSELVDSMGAGSKNARYTLSVKADEINISAVANR